MIIDNLILHDFGVYGGYQEILLTPASPEAPVVLFGGLNGAGKTTLLDALQLCLFGQVAQCSNRNGQAYLDYLAGCINKHARHKEALIGMDFRHTTNGKEESYHISRSWRSTGKGVSEQFDVLIDGVPAKTISNNWLQHIEEIMPANIAHLFFFDGEQAEDYVVADKASALIETAILNLLGLDIVNRLGKDLQTLERRKTIKDLNSKMKVEIDHIEKKIHDLKQEIERLHQKSAWLRTYEIDPRVRKLEELEEQFRNAGGELYERSAEIEASANKLEDELTDTENSLRRLAEGCLPIVLVQNLLEALEDRDVRERKAVRATETLNSLREVNKELLLHLRKSKASNETKELVKNFLSEKISQINKTVACVVENPLDEHARFALQTLRGKHLDKARKETTSLLLQQRDLKMKAEDAALEWNSVPKTSDIEDILNERKEVEQELDSSNKELEEITDRMVAAEKETQLHESNLQSILTEEAERTIKEEEKIRLLTHSEKARKTLEAFRSEVVSKHIRHIQTLVLENYQSLLRKKTLVASVTIDTETFNVSLRDQDRRLIPTERLSAGERQLLAVSLLWGMAKASGRPLPAAIDTPLGRLDSSHRQFLVQRYFPHASHQVLLFSTDQEVSGKYYEDLKKSVGRSYRLEYDDQTSTTKVVEGYLQ